jgi:hypothetical protein
VGGLRRQLGQDHGHDVVVQVPHQHRLLRHRSLALCLLSEIERVDLIAWFGL